MRGQQGVWSRTRTARPTSSLTRSRAPTRGATTTPAATRRCPIVFFFPWRRHRGWVQEHSRSAIDAAAKRSQQGKKRQLERNGEHNAGREEGSRSHSQCVFFCLRGSLIGAFFADRCCHNCGDKDCGTQRCVQACCGGDGAGGECGAGGNNARVPPSAGSSPFL